jgi:hypothetical protein
LGKLARLDAVAETILNRKLPLETLAELAQSNALAEHLRVEFRTAVLTRCVLLERFDLAQRIAPLLVGRIAKGADAHLTRFAGNPTAWHAVRWLARVPGARPYVLRGFGRLLPLHEISPWRGGWWGALTMEKMHQGFPPYRTPAPAEPVLLPKLPAVPDHLMAEREFETLRRKADSGRAWMLKETAAELRRNPKSEDGAEVLYRLVEGCLSMNMWSSEDDDQKTADAATRLLRVYFPRTKWLEMAERRRDPYGTAPLR